ncbi:hypothetical protein PENTCL1PPCAC_21493, partial [Pristionchus entomophagus]
CESELGASLPSILSDDDKQTIMHIRRFFLGFDNESLWIGLECGENGDWTWLNGEPWNGYKRFKDIREASGSCKDRVDTGHLFDSNGNWITGEKHTAKYFICSTRPEGYTRPPQDESTPTSGELLCPEGYSPFQAGEEYWCFVFHNPLPP